MDTPTTSTEEGKVLTFEENMASLQVTLDGIVAFGKYWKERCLAAEEYIDESPCDPDITKKQIIAHDYWQMIKKQQP